MKTTKMAAVFILFLIYSIPAFAKVTIDSFKGSLLVTGPDGSIKLVETGEPVPDIQEESTIEVFNGEFVLSAGAGEKIKFACGGNEGEAGSGGASINLSCGETGGLLKVVEGTAHLKIVSGKELDLKTGAEEVLTTIAAKAKPVAARQNSLGTSSTPPSEPDSRSIEASVSQ